MNSLHSLSKNEDGFVLIIAMVMLVILTLLGTFALNTTIFEFQITRNDRVTKQAFYKADGGLEVGIELIEQNLNCPGGFTSAPAGFESTEDPTEDPTTLFPIEGVDIADSDFALNEVIGSISGSPSSVDDLPEDNARTISIPSDPANRNAEHTNLAIWGQTQYVNGSAIQMAAGYEGRGKGAAGGGGSILYEVHAQHKGAANSISVLALEWRHLIGQEGSCKN